MGQKYRVPKKNALVKTTWTPATCGPRLGVLFDQDLGLEEVGVKTDPKSGKAGGGRLLTRGFVGLLKAFFF